MYRKRCKFFVNFTSNLQGMTRKLLIKFTSSLHRMTY